MVKKDALVARLEAKLNEIEGDFLSQKAEEVTEARTAIIKVLQENEISLPAAVFALDLVKMELMRGQLEEFLGHVKLTKELPLKTSDK